MTCKFHLPPQHLRCVLTSLEVFSCSMSDDRSAYFMWFLMFSPAAISSATPSLLASFAVALPCFPFQIENTLYLLTVPLPSTPVSHPKLLLATSQFCESSNSQLTASSFTAHHLFFTHICRQGLGWCFAFSLFNLLIPCNVFCVPSS